MTKAAAPILALSLLAAPVAFAQSQDAAPTQTDGFLDFDEDAVLDDAACGDGAEAWLNTTMVDLDDVWTLTFREPLGGRDTYTLEIDATNEDAVTIGGGLFAPEVPLQSAAAGGRPFETLGLSDTDTDSIEQAIGCAIDDLSRLSARGAVMEPSDQESILLRLVVASPRLMVGSVQLGVGDEAETRLVRVTR